MKAYICTLGCKVNQYESQAMMRLLQEHGYETAVFHPSLPDVGEAVLIVNSCTVTSESDRKLRQLVRRMRREHPQAILVVTGCMPQAFPDQAATLEADLVVGNAARGAIVEQLEALRRDRTPKVCVTPHDKTFERLSITSFEERTRAFVKIEDGCDRFCSYCIIPYARGRVRSRDPEDIRAELTALVKAGYREAVLVGINLTSYGKDTGMTLADAVDAACAVDGIERVRLGSLEPDHMTEELIARLKTQKKLCPQFHVALQSGCDATLRRMNRHYDTACFAQACQRLREAFPDAVFTTDILVGFPGETEADFEESLRFAEAMRFAKAHVFPYSRRAGTRADTMPDQVPQAEKAARAHRMSEACERVRRELLSEAVGSVQEVLCETRTADGAAVGYTRGYLPCRMTGACEAGQTVRVCVTEADSDGLTARIIG